MGIRPKRADRILLRLEDAEENRIRLLALQCRTSINEVIRKCIGAALGDVEEQIILEAVKLGKFRQLSVDQRRIEGFRTEISVNPELLLEDLSEEPKS